MATLTIRNLPDRVRERLRVRAAKRGVSMEAEARAILSHAVEVPSDRPSALAVSELQDWIAANRKRSRDERTDSSALIRDRRREAILEIVREGREPAEVFGTRYKRILAEAEWTDEDVKGIPRRPR